METRVVISFNWACALAASLALVIPAVGNTPVLAEESGASEIVASGNGNDKVSQVAERSRLKVDNEVVQIAAEDIWAYNISGTKPMTRVRRGGEDIAEEAPLLCEICDHLYFNILQDEEYDGGFIVVGQGMEALNNTHAILTGRLKPRAVFTQGTTLSAVFYEYHTQSSMELEKTLFERYSHFDGHILLFSYLVVPHEEAVVSPKLALINLPPLPTGKYGFERKVGRTTLQGEIKPASKASRRTLALFEIVRDQEGAVEDEEK